MKLYKQICSPAAIFLILCQAQTSFQYTHYVDDPDSCDIKGDPDIYGIGYRLSYYLSYAASAVAYFARDSETLATCRHSFTVVSLAVMINFIRDAKRGSFVYLEWCILFPLMFTLTILALAPSGSHEDFPVSYGVVIVPLVIAAGVFVWIAWALPYQGMRAGCAWGLGAGTISMDTAITVNKVLAIIMCLFAVMTLGTAVRPFILAVQQALGFEIPKRDSDSSHQEAPSNKKYKKRRLMLRGFFALCPAIGIGIVERLVAHNIDMGEAPFTATSQLIPFMIGLFTLVSALWSVLKTVRTNMLEKSQKGVNDSESLALQTTSSAETLLEDEQEVRRRLEGLRAEEQERRQRIEQFLAPETSYRGLTGPATITEENPR